MKLFLPYSIFRKVYITLVVFVLILLSGTLGYMFIEHYSYIDALYMTVITLSTVGFTEVKPLDDAGKVFSIVLIIINLGAFTYFVTWITGYFLSGEFASIYKLYKMKNSIQQLEGHIIICGFGRNGREAAKIIYQNKKDFVAVEKSPVRKEDLSFPVEFLVEDDATRDEALLEAGIKTASALITCLSEDADNLFVVLTARELNPNIKIISRASNDSTVRKLRSAGANNVIMPDKIGGAHMATLVLSPDVKEFIDLMATQSGEHFEITEVVASRDVTLETLNCWMETGATVLGIKTHGDYILNPPPKTAVKPGNRLIMMGSRTQLEKAKRHLL